MFLANWDELVPDYSSVCSGCQTSKRDDKGFFRLESETSQKLGVLWSALYFTMHLYTRSHLNVINRLRKAEEVLLVLDVEKLSHEN